MKTGILLTGALLVVIFIGFNGGEKSKDLNVNDIKGVYHSASSVLSSLNAASLDRDEGDHGSAVVSLMGNNQIEVHCFGKKIDTSFMLDYYEHNDSVLVCLTGDEFEYMYGHMDGGRMKGHQNS